MRIIICDDDEFSVNKLKAHVDGFMKCRFIECEIDTATNPETVVQNNIVYQLAFLDIKMDERSGISLAKILLERNSKLIIFFITSFNSYQDDAMDLRAFRFFEKPFNAERLNSGLEKALEYINESYVDFYLLTNNEHKQILMEDVIYAEKSDRQVTLHTTAGDYDTKETMDEWCDILQNLFFYRIHKSFIVNVHYITSYRYAEIIVRDNISLPIASKRRSDFRDFWFSYLRRR